MKSALLLLAVSGYGFAQPGNIDYFQQIKNRPFLQGSGAPSNPCTHAGSVYYRTDNQTSYYCATNAGSWALQAGGGGGGVGAAYQLTDFAVTKTSGTVETINAAAGSTAPIIGRVGQTAFTFTTAATATISGSSSTGTVRWCLRSDGSLAVAHNLSATITGSGLTVITSASACPATSIQLWATTMTANVWDAIAESMDTRSFLSYKPSPTAGAGIAVTAGSTDVIAADTTILAQKFFGTTAPGSVSGNLPGDFYTDTTAKHLYECQAVAGTAAPACTSVTANGWTQIDGGGSTSTFIDHQGASGAITGDATDHTVFTTTITGGTIANGHCIAFQWALNNGGTTGTIVYKIFLGSTNVTFNSSAEGNGYFASVGAWTICNNSGSHTVQQSSFPNFFFSNGGNLTSTSVTPGDTTLAADLSTNQVLKLTFNGAATTTVTPLSWLVWSN